MVDTTLTSVISIRLEVEEEQDRDTVEEEIKEEDTVEEVDSNEEHQEEEGEGEDSVINRIIEADSIIRDINQIVIVLLLLPLASVFIVN